MKLKEITASNLLVKIMMMSCLLNISFHSYSYPRQSQDQLPNNSAKTPLQRALEVLDTAQDHLVVLPEKSAQLLSSNNDLLKVLDENNQARWYFTLVLSAIKLSDLDNLHSSLVALSGYQQTPFFVERQTRILNALGIWFRRSGYYAAARTTYRCNLDLPASNKNKLITLLNLAVVERNLSNYNVALELNRQALEMAKQQEEEAITATIKNNLGIIAFTQQDYSNAENYFTKSMYLNQKLKRRISEILSGNNLLLTFLASQQYELFDRLSPRIERLLSRAPDGARKAYLDILLQIRRLTTQHSISDSELAQLRSNIESVNDQGIVNLIRPLLTKLSLAHLIPEDNAPKTYQSDLHLLFNVCDWQKYAQDIRTNMLIFSESP